MPYAANGIIAEDEFAGSIKITADQYAEALEGMCTGLVVTIDGGFKVTAPAPVPPAPSPVLTPEELIAAALAQRDQLLRVAAIRIAPLQDAIDLGQDTEEDVTNLKRWKQYRVALNRVAQQSAFPSVIDWPVAPS